MYPTPASVEESGVPNFEIIELFDSPNLMFGSGYKLLFGATVTVNVLVSSSERKVIVVLPT